MIFSCVVSSIMSIRAGRLKNEPLPVIFDRITEVIETYNYATKPNYLKPGMLMM